MAASTFKQSDIARAIKASQGAGLTVAEIFVTRDGVRIITPDGAPRHGGKVANPWDEELSSGAAG